MDAIAAGARRDISVWMKRQRQAFPRDAQIEAAIFGGVAGAILDRLHELSDGDPEAIRKAWLGFGEGYIDHMAEDRAADQETPAMEPRDET